MATKVIYFTIAGKNEKAEFRADDRIDDVKELFRSAAEAGPHDIMKLYKSDSSIVAISSKLPENTPMNRYRLEVVATLCPGSVIAAELGMEISAMEARLSNLELQISDVGGKLPVSVKDLQTKVEEFKVKLESVEHLSWLGLFKNVSCGTTPTSGLPFWNRTKSKAKTEKEEREVFDRFLYMTNVKLTEDLKTYLKTPAFDNWQWDESEMLILLRQMFIDLDFITEFKIELRVLHRWLYEVYRSYNMVPFHNFKHGFMVAQMMYGIIWLVDLASYMTSIDLLILISAAICHDLDHPGYNNAYQVNAKTQLALRYNDISPLENHHCAVAFELLQNPDANIFANLTPEQYKTVRAGLIKCILATDMANHSEILKNFKSIMPHLNLKEKSHKDILMMILIKMADVSNEVRPMEVAEPWYDCLLEEFFNQSDIEKLEGLPVSPFMDREKVDKCSSQVSFIQFVLLPLFEALGELFPKMQDEIIQPVRFALDYYSKGLNPM